MYLLKLKIYKDGVFQSIHSTLHSWLHVVREYTYRVPKDLINPKNKDYSWWHGERPQVGFLSIAAWLNGWAVLEEWGTKKERGTGRNDLWIGRGETEFFIEAKHRWCWIYKGADWIDKDIRNHVNAAEYSARNLIKKTPGKRIAATFISPTWNHNSKFCFEEARALWVQKVCEHKGAVALIAPTEDECPRNEKELFVGSVLLLTHIEN
jgi:hypothetical protein